MPPSDNDKVVLSKKTKPTAPDPTVSIVSPWKTGSPVFRSNEVPSKRMALTVPVMLDTSPIDKTSFDVAWTYLPGESGPAKAFNTEPLSNKPFSVIIEGNSKLEK